MKGFFTTPTAGCFYLQKRQTFVCVYDLGSAYLSRERAISMTCTIWFREIQCDDCWSNDKKK